MENHDCLRPEGIQYFKDLATHTIQKGMGGETTLQTMALSVFTS